jgi:hypothetical protein
MGGYTETPVWARRARKIWIVLLTCVVLWHFSLISIPGIQRRILVLTAYVVVCFPMGLVVIPLLAWASGSRLMPEDRLNTARADLFVAALFLIAGLVQWFLLIPWISSRLV